MSEASKAVFLSYASQDVEAAKRICAALRAAGVEVWFDQSELVGGDAWDQKIRKQIKDCALLIPIISKSTQGRREAYFRLEWKLADERTHLMAKGTPFLLPVTIDDTSDRDALVPDSFLAVQWTKAPGGEVPAAFCARVETLLKGDDIAAALRRDGSEDSRHKAAPTRTRTPRWMKPVLASAVGVVIAFGIALALRPDREVTAKPPTVPPPAPAANERISPARQLANKALTATNMQSPGPELGAAIKQAERATTMDDLDGEIWAISALVDLSAYEMSWDHSDERRDAIRAKITKAKGLAPRAPLTRYAEAKGLIRIDSTPDSLTAALDILEGLRAENPPEPGAPKVLGLIGLTQQAQGRFEAAALSLEQAGWENASSWAWLMAGNLPRALAMAQRQTATDPIGGRSQETMVQFARGDLAALQAVTDSMPAAARVGEVSMSWPLTIAYLHRDADGLLEIARQSPKPFLDNRTFLLTSRGYYVGQAYAWLGRTEAARAEWIEALRLVEERQAKEGASKQLGVTHMFLLVRLGRNDDAARELNVFRQQDNPGWGLPVVGLLTALGRTDEALTEMEQLLTSNSGQRWFLHPLFRYDPEYDPLHGNPRYEKLLRDTLLPGAKPFDLPIAPTKS